MFRDRNDAALQLANLLRPLSLRNPLILAIPCGGVEVGSILAQELKTEFDVLISRKLRFPTNGRPFGAVAENGVVRLDRKASGTEILTAEEIVRERIRQLAEIARLRSAFREIRGPASLSERTVVLTDDGVVTGLTLSAALDALPRHLPQELIVAVPIASRERLSMIHARCDHVVCGSVVESLESLGDCYHDFPAVRPEEATEMFRRTVLHN